VSFKTEKNRDGEPLQWSARAVWVGDKQFYLEPAATVRDEPQAGSSQDYVLEYLEKNGPSPVQDIEAHADGCTAKAAKLALYKLAEVELVRRTQSPAGPKDRRAWYELVSQDTENVD
jgi:hypothetical protein